jgi:hypothetical protein
LSATCKSPGTYDLHRFDSRTWAWSHEVVPLVAPQAAFPFQVPIYQCHPTWLPLQFRRDHQRRRDGVGRSLAWHPDL